MFTLVPAGDDDEQGDEKERFAMSMGVSIEVMHPTSRQSSFAVAFSRQLPTFLLAIFRLVVQSDSTITDPITASTPLYRMLSLLQQTKKGVTGCSSRYNGKKL